MKAILVVDIPNLIEPCEIDELGFVADLHIKPTTLCTYDPFYLKDVDVRPLPNDYPPYGKIREQNFYTEEESDAYEKGWNDCLEELEK